MELLDEFPDTAELIVPGIETLHWPVINREWLQVLVVHVMFPKYYTTLEVYGEKMGLLKFKN